MVDPTSVPQSVWEDPKEDTSSPLSSDIDHKVDKFIRIIEGVLNAHDEELTRRETGELYEILEDLRETRGRRRHPSHS